MYFWILILPLLLGDLLRAQIFQKYAIGVIGKKWMNILNQTLYNRKDEKRVILKPLVSNKSTVLFDEMMYNSKQLKKLKINLIIGDFSLPLAQTAAHMTIPYISLDRHIVQSGIPGYSSMPYFYSLTLPEYMYSKAIMDLLNKFLIRKVSVIIDSSVGYDSFLRPFLDQKVISVKVWTLDQSVTKDIKKLSDTLDNILEESKECNVWDFVVKAEISMVKAIISKAKYYGMLVHPNRWYLPSFVCFDVNIADIRQINSNITFINEQCSESILRQNQHYSNTAIINKAIQIFRLVNWRLIPTRLHRMLRLNHPRLFDEKGIHSQTSLSLYTVNMNEMSPDNLLSVGLWMYNGMTSHINYTYREPETLKLNSNVNYHIRVSAVEEHPHLIVSDNNTFVGFGIDLLIELSKLMNFTYSIKLTDSVGSKEHINWTGIVGEICNNNADISLGPLVQTREIEEVLDFSTSFKQREISLVIKKSSPSNSLFQFLSPFSTNVWICCLVILVIFTLAMWALEYFHNLYLPSEDNFPLDLKESSWVAIACCLKQQMEIFPKSIPGRIVHWMIIFFSLMIITSYTANLAAFLTIKVYKNPINDVEDLIKLPIGSPIYFGTVRDSPILEFFENSKMETFKKIYRLMKKNPDWLVNNSREGYQRALSEPYVFIWDDSVNQFEIFEDEYNCTLNLIGRPFGKRSFAIGMKPGFPLLKKINENLLYIIESGKRENLEKKWWKSNSNCDSDNNAEGEQEPLKINEIFGAFLIALFGVVASISWLAGQIIVYKLKQNKTRQLQTNFLKSGGVNHVSTIKNNGCS